MVDIVPTILVIIFLVSVIVLYPIPAIIAYQRDLYYRDPIIALNIFLGWVPVIWVALLVWSVWPK